MRASSIDPEHALQRPKIKALAQLLSHWPPPQTFRRQQVVRRIPWFPAWWFDDLVKRGYLQHAAGDPKKGVKYCLSDLSTLSIALAREESHGEPRAMQEGAAE